jgi:GDP-D-mannose 3',5'-epimerase
MRVLVAGAGGFIGGHLVARLLAEGNQVRAVDIKPLNEWYQTHELAENLVRDLSRREKAFESTLGVEQVFNLAADMGGMGFIENNKALCMLTSLINTHLLQGSVEAKVRRFFFSSSACVYASWHQQEAREVHLRETDAYPADPEDGYGWEKLFAERMCRHFQEDFGLEVRIARYHNVYGPFGTYTGGREKVPAAACRKVINFRQNPSQPIQIWGDGQQIRSFTYIDDCIEGTMRLMKSSFSEPLNIGSSESVSIQSLYDLICENEKIQNPKYQYDFSAPQGVRGRSSDNTLCEATLNWIPQVSLKVGISKTFKWIDGEMTRLEE